MTSVKEIIVPPGGFYFGGADYCLKTLLGSCIAITLWHRPSRQGGMCHYLLPEETRTKVGKTQTAPDGRYANDAMTLFNQQITQRGLDRREIEAKIFGGAKSFSSAAKHAKFTFDVGQRNIEAGFQLLKSQGFRVVSHHVAGCGRRNIIFNIETGDVWVRYVPGAQAHSDSPHIYRRED